MEFAAIVVSSTAEYLVTDREDIQKSGEGVDLSSPYIFNEDGDAQAVDSVKTFLPYSSLEAIHYGSFEEETLTKHQ